MTPNTADLADLPASLGPLPFTASRPPVPPPPPDHPVSTPLASTSMDAAGAGAMPEHGRSSASPVASSIHQNRSDLVGHKPVGRDCGESFLSPSIAGPIKDFSVIQLNNEARVETRAEMDENTIEDYAEAMRAGAKFPPVVVFDNKVGFWMSDGCHRVEAADRAGLTTIKAEVRIGGRLEALKYALGANARHGLRRTNADKRRCVETALQEFPDESDRAIAKLCGVGNVLVGEVRRQVFESNTSPVRKGRDGKQYPAARAPGQKLVHPAAPLRESTATPSRTLPVSAPDQEESAQTVDAVPDAVEIVTGGKQQEQADIKGDEVPLAARETRESPSSCACAWTVMTRVAPGSGQAFSRTNRSQSSCERSWVNPRSMIWRASAWNPWTSHCTAMASQRLTG